MVVKDEARIDTFSFLVGFWVSFLITAALGGMMISNKFVSKESLLSTRYVFIDGKAYTVKPK